MSGRKDYEKRYRIIQDGKLVGEVWWDETVQKYNAVITGENFDMFFNNISALREYVKTEFNCTVRKRV